jgi:nucleotide-binding universal stress UspA family protein
MDNKGSTPQLRTDKILMAIDRSPSKDKVVLYGSSLAKALQAQLIAIHVIEKSSNTPGLKDFEKDYENSRIRDAENLLNEAKESGKAMGLEIDTEIVVRSRSVADSIMDYAKNKNVDLILVGTIGMTGLQKYLLGSVADKIVTHAHCPVLAVR